MESLPVEENKPAYSLSSWKGWRPLLVALIVLGVGIPLLLSSGATSPQPQPKVSEHVDKISIRIPSIRDTRVHKVTTGTESGVKVLRVIAVEGGEEIIIDATTGSLLGIRDKQGKTTWRAMIATKEMETPPVKS